MKKHPQKWSALLLLFAAVWLAGARPASAQDCFGDVGAAELSTTPFVFSGAATNLTRAGSALQTSVIVGSPCFTDVSGAEGGLSFGPFAYHLLQPRPVNTFTVLKATLLIKLWLRGRKSSPGLAYHNSGSFAMAQRWQRCPVRRWNTSTRTCRPAATTSTRS